MENTKNTKQLKKQLMAAIAMFLVAAIALGSSTYAWFVSNYQVSATDMKVQAKAESGIVISNAVDGPYATTAATSTAAKELGPTCTLDLSTWKHSTSDQYDSANKNQAEDSAYQDITSTNPYSLNHFYIKSAGAGFDLDSTKGLEISGIKVVNQEVTQKLSKSLRLGVKVETVKDDQKTTSITTYAPCRDNDVEATKYSMEALNSKTTDQKITGVEAMPANNGTPIHVEIYLWFDGEDDECKSSNIQATLEQLNVTVNFKANAQATQN